MNDKDFNYDTADRDFYSMPPGCLFWIGVLAAIAITIGVLIAVNS